MSNVVRLPGCGKRVRQPSSNFGTKSLRAHGIMRLPIDGDDREDEYSTLTRSPELLLVMCIIKALTPEAQRELHRQVVSVDAARPCEDSAAALMIAHSLTLPAHRSQ